MNVKIGSLFISALHLYSLYIDIDNNTKTILENKIKC